MWTPTARIVQAAAPPSFRFRGICPPDFRCWPDAALGSGADYSVDFSGLLGDDEFVTSCDFGNSLDAQQSWTSISGNIATAWIVWLSPGCIVVPVCVITNVGNTYQVDVNICVSPEGVLIPPIAPPAPSDYLTAISVNGSYISCNGALIVAG